MQNIDTLLHAKWVIPVGSEPAESVYQDYAIAIDKGRIIELLASKDTAEKYQAKENHQLNKHVLLPGLVNTHGHAAMTLMRGLADDLPLMTWLNDHIWPTEAKWVSRDFVYDGSLIACAEMLRGGTTCFTDMYFFPEEVARAAQQAKIRATLGLIVIDFPSAYAQNAEEYISKGLSLHDQLRGNPFIKTSFAPHAPYTVTDTALQRINILAEELDIPIQIHLHETENEVAQAIQQSGQHANKRPLQRLEDLGLLSSRLIAVHMTQLTDEEIKKLSTYGVHIAHCPESNLKLASGFCPVQKCLDANINVSLGTDGAASNNDLDMFSEMRTAALLAKAVAKDASALSAEKALRMATINGAKALGLDKEIGSLEAGKAADIIAVDFSALETQPIYNPISQLVYVANRQQVSDVWVAGNHVVKQHRLTSLDTEQLCQTAQQWQQKIHS
ncbi:TRZ/ATZ family hydrolase [Beggiatoa alba]|nr:TRZ/ATZ family hydrolase [Beggiatoa alba]